MGTARQGGTLEFPCYPMSALTPSSVPNARHTTSRRLPSETSQNVQPPLAQAIHKNCKNSSSKKQLTTSNARWNQTVIYVPYYFENPQHADHCVRWLLNYLLSVHHARERVTGGM